MYLAGESATVPDAVFAAAISCITDSFCVPLLSTARTDFCNTPVLSVVTVTLIPVTVALA